MLKYAGSWRKMKMSIKMGISVPRIYKITVAVLVLTCFLGVSTGIVEAMSRGPPTLTPFTTSEVRTDFKMLKMYPMNDLTYIRAVSYWDIEESDDPRMTGNNEISIYGLMNQDGVPQVLWGRFKVKQGNAVRWRGHWQSGFDAEGVPVVFGHGYGVGPYRGLRFVATYYTGPDNELGQMTENAVGYILDPYGRG